MRVQGGASSNDTAQGSVEIRLRRRARYCGPVSKLANLRHSAGERCLFRCILIYGFTGGCFCFSFLG
ncbi:hypothetical protein BDV06DRAFT_181622, partial [Aspergillus oleicola]